MMKKNGRVFSMAEKAPVGLTDILEAFRAGGLLVQDYMNQLRDLFEEREPLVRAFVTEIPDCFDSFLKTFDQLEARFPEPSSRPGLYGVPVGVKDIFHVTGFPTRAGSRLPTEVLEGPEAKAVTILKSAGALVLGKTVTAEFAHLAPGPTRNPHNLEHTPGGSSSGSAAAVAAGLCPLALGTQTGGSLLRPASYCGVVGFKPSYGRISAEGVIPQAPSLDHVGLITADIEGAIIVAQVLCDNWTQVRAIPRPVLGVPEGAYLEKASEEGLNHFRLTCDHLADAGFEIRHIEMLTDVEKFMEYRSTLVAAEAALVHRQWFSKYSDRYEETTAELIEKGQSVGSGVLRKCRAGREKFRDEILVIMERNNLSALITPAATGPAPRGLKSTGDSAMNNPWTYAGLPAVNLPSGTSQEGLPLGLQMVGSWMADEILLEMARHVAKFFR
jgi:Asp-tRNA(Asn)/Glu-tRNA(Gln) amidotransferase A subunit family amidase